MGFKDCRKQHIPHQDGVNSHVIHSHKRAWTALELDRQDRMREEDRQVQRELTEAIKLAVVKGVVDQGEATSGYLRLDQEDVQSVEPIITTTGLSNIELIVDVSTDTAVNPDTPFTLTDSFHTHAYRGKKAGSACKVEGCLVVRSTDAKPRAKKNVEKYL